MSWPELAHWWLSEIEADPAYESVVTPLVLDILAPRSGSQYADLGSGDGRVARSVRGSGARVVGVDMAEELAGRLEAPVVVADLFRIPARDRSLDGAYAVLVLEHLSDHRAFFKETSRIVKEGGSLAIVSNHPVWTAPGSTPIQDEDGEILWRPGEYFATGVTEVDVAGGSVVFHHRSMGELLRGASDGGWSLERMIERPHHSFEGQSSIPRLLAIRWRR